MYISELRSNKLPDGKACLHSTYFSFLYKFLKLHSFRTFTFLIVDKLMRERSGNGPFNTVRAQSNFKIQNPEEICACSNVINTSLKGTQNNFDVLLDKQTVTFREVIKFLEEIVADQHEKTEVTCVYNVFDPDQKGHVPVSEIQEALHIWYGNRISEEEVQEILAFADQDNNGFVKEQGTCVRPRSFGSFNSSLRTTDSVNSLKGGSQWGFGFYG